MDKQSADRWRDKLKAQFSAGVAALIALSIGGVGGSAQASGTTSAPSRSESRYAAAAVNDRAEHHVRVARRVDWSAGPVARWNGYSRSGGSLRGREVQRTPGRLDYPPGPADGLFGPRTERAVARFQRAEALPQDGIVGPRTLRRLHVRAGDQWPMTSSPKSGARSPDRPKLGPVPQTRPAPAPMTVPTGPANRGPGRGVGTLLGLLVALLGLLVFAGALAARQGRVRTAGAAAESPAAGLPAGPAAPAPESSTKGSSNGSANGSRPSGPRLGELLCDAGVLSRGDLTAALHEQDRSSGPLGASLTASGTIPVATVTQALARQLRTETLRRGDRPMPLLEVQDARDWRAIALNGGSKPANGGVAVAITDPSKDVLADPEATLGRRVESRLADEATLDELPVVRIRRRRRRRGDADAFARRCPSSRRSDHALEGADAPGMRPRLACVLGFVLAVGLLADLLHTATVLVGIATAFFVVSTSFRALSGRRGVGNSPTDRLPAVGSACVATRAEAMVRGAGGWRERGKRPSRFSRHNRARGCTIP